MGEEVPLELEDSLGSPHRSLSLPRFGLEEREVPFERTPGSCCTLVFSHVGGRSKGSLSWKVP